jgi:hypothetical protein
MTRKNRRTWEDNIKIDLKEGADWTVLAEDRDQWRALFNMIINL